MKRPLEASSARAGRIGRRRIDPELLDELPADDPRARRSRCDLRRVNWWMGNAQVLYEALDPLAFKKVPPRLVELGGGDGTFLLEVARRLPRTWAGAALEIVDRQNLLTDETAAAFNGLGWHARAVEADAFAWLERADPVDAIFCNLFLHHFENDRLADLFRRIALKTERFAACEPRRYRFPGLAGRLVWLIGCNSVTRHDAVASVRAGFAGEELSALWPEANGWELKEGAAGLFSHHFAAQLSLPGSGEGVRVWKAR